MLVNLRFVSFETQLKTLVARIHTLDPNEVRSKFDTVSVSFRGDPGVSQSRIDELLCCEKDGAARRVWEPLIYIWPKRPWRWSLRLRKERRFVIQRFDTWLRHLSTASAQVPEPVAQLV